MFLTLTFALAVAAAPPDEPWPRHTIDDTSKGADGARPGDVNGDGLPDLAVAWEEGSVIRAYLHPGHAKVREPWPRVTVGKVRKPEDAVFVDVDGDGRMDVVSSCENGVETLYAHLAPRDPADYLDETKWRTEPFPATVKLSAWMWTLPLEVDGRNGVDLFIGSKAKAPLVAWVEAPADRTRPADWKLHKVRDAGWIMTLAAHDFDADGDLDVLVSDRKGKGHAVCWLENPGPVSNREGAAWHEHVIDRGQREYTFASLGPVGTDDEPAVVCTQTGGGILVFRRGDGADVWLCEEIPMPPGTGTGKSATPADLDLDGDRDLVVTCEHADGELAGAFWLEYVAGPTPEWKPRVMGGPVGLKFDRAELLDLDGDGDLDVVTCEERDQLGVVWYENPTKR